MKTLIVVSHPRDNSLTKSIAREIERGLLDNHHDVEYLDLYKEKFNSITYIEDEADYNNIDKEYSDFVEKEIKRLKEIDTLIFVFPVYWHNLPAMIKGYIDRVFNYGFAYGNGNKLPVRRIRWIPLAGNIEEKYIKRGYDQNMSYQLNVGISDYVGVKDSKVDFVWDSLGESKDIINKENYFKEKLNQAYVSESHYSIEKEIHSYK